MSEDIEITGELEYDDYISVDDLKKALTEDFKKTLKDVGSYERNNSTPEQERAVGRLDYIQKLYEEIFGIDYWSDHSLK
jgi:hypothetical protein